MSDNWKSAREILEEKARKQEEQARKAEEEAERERKLAEVMQQALNKKKN